MAQNIKIIAITAAILAAAAPAATASEVTVTFGNVSSEDGTIYASLCDRTGYKKMVKGGCLRSEATPAREGAQITFKDVPTGDWGVSSFHDENDNRKLDSNFFRMPLEATGASNNAVGNYGPPTFDQIKFSVGEADVDLAIDLRRVRAK